ncbi:MAG: cadherin-like beta sandwich domain-containing protein [Clostridiales bacterium]|nr:cadherin-like beta sandwich domain-containing protein [Clostridiales bacterium]
MQRSIWSKPLSLILMAAMILGMLLITNFSPANAGYGSNGKFLAPIEAPDPNAIQIFDAQGLYDVRNNLINASYVLMKDIDLATFNGGLWDPICFYNASKNKWEYFSGVFDGQGHVIKNLRSNGGGLFYSADGVIKNIGLENVSISGDGNVGGICNISSYGVIISNCYTTGLISISKYVGGISCNDKIGGIVGSGRNSIILNCWNSASLSADVRNAYYGCAVTIGGICGYNSGLISNCYNVGSVSSEAFCYDPNRDGAITYTGGICGNYSSNGNTGEEIRNCYNIGSISSDAERAHAGGICAGDGGIISASYNSGSVSAYCADRGVVGGICGSDVAFLVQNCVVLAPSVSITNRSYINNAKSYLIGGAWKINNLALSSISGNYSDDSNGRISPAQAADQSTYANLGWDFKTVWQMAGGYPQLNIRILSGDANLVSLGASPAILDQTFIPSTINYTATVPYSTSSINITATASHPNASILGTGVQNLLVGANSFIVTVTAEDDITTKNYSIMITREQDPALSDATLSSLTISNSVLNPVFNPDITSYEASVPYEVSSMTITASPNYPEASVLGTGSKELIVGANTFEIPVTAKDGTTTKTYTIAINRQGSTDVIVILTGVADNQDLGDDFNRLFIYEVTLRNPVDATIKYTAEMSILPDTRDGYKSNGLFTIREGVEDGKYILELKAPGYLTKWEYVTIEPDARDLGSRTLLFGDFNGDFCIDYTDYEMFESVNHAYYLDAGEEYETKFDFICSGYVFSNPNWQECTKNLNRDFSSYGQDMIDIYENEPLRKLLLGENTTQTFDQAVELLKEKPAIDISAYEPADIIAYLEEQIYTLTGFVDPEVRQLGVDKYYFMNPDGGDNYLLNIFTSVGISVSGKIKSYDPNKPVIIRLMQDGEIVCETDIAVEKGYGQEAQSFFLKGISPGTYDLVISKAAHAKFTIQNLIVEDEDLDLTISGRPESQLITLRCGDINGDGLINDADLTILWRAGNYNKKASEADEPLCDLNGDGLINDADLTILWLASNYNRGGIIIPWELPAPFQKAIVMLDKNGPIPIPSAVQEDIDKTIAFLKGFITNLVSTATGLDPIEVRYWAESDGGDDGFYLIDPDKVAGNDYKLKTMQAAKPVSKTINCLAGKEYSISFGIKGLDAVNGRQFKLSYDADKLELIDLAAQTKALDTETGSILDTNIFIVSHEVDEKLGIIIFMVDKTLNSESLWQGAVNIIKFKAKTSGDAVMSSEILQ